MPISPMMKQYLNIKIENEEYIIFYRLGDFYEMFFNDAITVSSELELTLTGRDCGLPERAPMCGVPFHSADGYIAKLVARGYKVAVCEQLTDPAETKGIVERGIIRVITPGTVTDVTNSLDETKNNFLCSVFGDEVAVGMVFADVSTGELNVINPIVEDRENRILSELCKFTPSEIIINSGMSKNKILVDKISKLTSPCVDVNPDDFYVSSDAINLIKEHFGDDEIANGKISDSSQTMLALYALLDYLFDTQKNELKHVNSLEVFDDEQFVDIDLSTKRNLELTETLREKKKYGSLLGVLDKTGTSMGARLLRSYIDRPLKNLNGILKRHNAVDELIKESILREELSKELKEICDIERLCSRISYRNANARDLISLKNSLLKIPSVKEKLKNIKAPLLKEINSELDCMADITDLIEKAINDDPPFSVRDGNMIKDGYDATLDNYRLAMTDGKTWLAEVEAEEKEKTGIKGMKVGYNRVFGYYIEVLKSVKDELPDYYIRKQTLTNCERYITPKLKEIESTILGASEKSINLEYDLFCKVREVVYENIVRIQKNAKAIAKLDVMISFAYCAYKNRYVKPEMAADGTVVIKEGRHPVVEQVLKDSYFIPNDTYLDRDKESFSIITGPNMAGKSTYMRQVALIVLMAQIGSFVPCEYAKLPIVDKIFTRVGASDDLASGQSTFMVEMNEVANILKNATSESLIILDEIGRGTSTFDGLSIAWAVVEHIVKNIGAKTLFATHYHELTVLEERMKGIKNYSVAVKKRGDDITFLRKIVEGGTDESFGIEVAKLAGVPNGVVKRAKEIAVVLEGNELSLNEISNKAKKVPERKDENQIVFGNMNESEIISKLKSMDVTTLTPIEAMNILFELAKKAKDN